MGIDAEMFVRTKQGYTPEQVRHMAHDLAEAFGHERFMISRPGEWTWYPNGRHCLELVAEYEQDGPTIEPGEGEQFIQVSLWTRYYGAGYERGDWPFIDSVGRWLEARIPDAEVWYGGDSSGVCAKPLQESREALWELFCGVGHGPYERYFGRSGLNPTCDFCQRPMIEYGWGPNHAIRFRCAGCGHKLMTEDRGKTFQEIEDRE